MSRLGERESGTARLEEAVTAYRAALTEQTRERVPLYWAGTQNNLGVALRTLGERERGTARLEEAVAAFREALKEYTRAGAPYYWAYSQENLGIVFRILATRTSGNTRLTYLQEALEAVEGALQVYHEGNGAYDIGTAERLRAASWPSRQRLGRPKRRRVVGWDPPRPPAPLWTLLFAPGPIRSLWLHFFHSGSDLAAPAVAARRSVRIASGLSNRPGRHPPRSAR